MNRDRIIGFVIGALSVMTIFAASFTFVPEYTVLYKQGVKDTLANNVKGKVTCEMVIRDNRGK